MQTAHPGFLIFLRIIILRLNSGSKIRDIMDFEEWKDPSLQRTFPLRKRREQPNEGVITSRTDGEAPAASDAPAA